MKPSLKLRGFEIFQGFLSRGAQQALVEDLRAVLTMAPLVHPVTARGQQMSVRMSAAGVCGWVSDAKGYRYETTHPRGTPWPAIPERVLDVWSALSGQTRVPDCCLINYYAPDARMGMHQDKDEASFDWPVVSISLGDDGLFRMGHETRGGKTESLWLRSGDVVVMGGAARLCHHGIDRIKPGTSTLLPRPGRINVTLRVVY